VASNFSAKSVYALGLVAFAIAYAGIGLQKGVGLVAYALVALYGFFPALTDGIGKSMIAAATPKRIHGTAQGMYQSLQGGAILIAGTWAGLSWSAGNGHGSIPFLIAGLVALAAAVYFMATRRTRS
jgi:sugar phosphate permease